MELARRIFTRGWVPDVDAVNAPPDALLRADNLMLDELGALTLRPGTTKLNGTPTSELDIHSLFTVVRDGTKIRYGGAGSQIYRNAVTPIGVTMAGSGDVAFGSHMGQTFFARSTSKYKDDGTTVRNWGISMTGGAPEIVGAIASDTREFASWDSTETTHAMIEGDDGGITYDEDHLAVANGAIEATPETTTGRLILERLFASDQDFTTLLLGRDSTDEDQIKFWLYASNPLVIQKTQLMIDVNGGDFINDYYIKEWPGEGAAGVDHSVANPGGGSDPGDPGSGEAPLI